MSMSVCGGLDVRICTIIEEWGGGGGWDWICCCSLEVWDGSG